METNRWESTLLRAFLGLALALLGAGCDGIRAGDAGSAAGVADLPECGPAPSPAPDPVPDGALLPGESRMTDVQSAQPPVVHLNAYVPLTPDEVVAFAEQQGGVSVEQAAGDAGERELLLTARQHRIYVKARAICASGSRVLQVLAPRDSDAQIPAPGSSAPES